MKTRIIAFVIFTLLCGTGLLYAVFQTFPFGIWFYHYCSFDQSVLIGKALLLAPMPLTPADSVPHILAVYFARLTVASPMLFSVAILFHLATRIFFGLLRRVAPLRSVPSTSIAGQAAK